MLTLTEKFISAREYLEQERNTIREQGGKHEYVNGKILLMSGASEEHNIIAGNLFALLWFFLRERDYKVFQNDMRVHNPDTNSYTYPDVVVVMVNLYFWITEQMCC
jgi:Uma2 family endonuclease